MAAIEFWSAWRVRGGSWEGAMAALGYAPPQPLHGQGRGVVVSGLSEPEDVHDLWRYAGHRAAGAGSGGPGTR